MATFDGSVRSSPRVVLMLTKSKFEGLDNTEERGEVYQCLEPRQQPG